MAQMNFEIAMATGAIAVGVVLSWLYAKRRSKDTALGCVPKGQKLACPLIEKQNITHDTARYRFGLPKVSHALGLPIGQHIFLSATINGKYVSRAYTPVSSDKHKGYFDLVLKVYRAGVHPKFPDGGLMSQHVDSLKLQQTIDIKGPLGSIRYTSPGTFHVGRKDAKQFKCRHIAMIAGGTGVTPMLQVVRQIMSDAADQTEVSLLFANQTEDDILLRDELEAFEKSSGGKFRVWYTLDRPPTEWKYSSGFINADMIKENLHPATADTVVLLCGPPPMIKFACKPSLEALGYDDARVFSF